VSGVGSTDDDIQFARKAGLVTFVQLPDGTVYAPLGGGTTTGRLGKGRVGVQVVETCDRFSELVMNAESVVRKKVGELVELAARQGVQMGTKLRFHLSIEGPSVYAVETTHRVKFKLGAIVGSPA